jgi:hypothetical protein
MEVTPGACCGSCCSCLWPFLLRLASYVCQLLLVKQCVFSYVHLCLIRILASPTHPLTYPPAHPPIIASAADEQRFIKYVLAFFAASDGIVSENLSNRFMNGGGGGGGGGAQQE